MSEELLRYVDLIHSQKDIPREVVFRALEEALAAGVRKRLGLGEDLVCTIDRDTGAVATEDDELYEELKGVLFNDSAVAGEAAAIGMGLIMLGSGSQKVIEEMLEDVAEYAGTSILR